jgi:hypothetical protein
MRASFIIRVVRPTHQLRHRASSAVCRRTVLLRYGLAMLIVGLTSSAVLLLRFTMVHHQVRFPFV